MTARELAQRLVTVEVEPVGPGTGGPSSWPWQVLVMGEEYTAHRTRAEAGREAASLRLRYVPVLEVLLSGDGPRGMHPQERAFVRALARDAADVDAACAYADWLEENGRHEAGARVRRLAPQSGDVLVFTAQEMATADEDLKRLNAVAWTAAAVRKRLAAHGRDVCCVVLSEGETLEDMGEDAMRAAGWVRQERLAEALLVGAAAERAACAEIAEGADGYAERDGEIWYPGERIAEAIRSRNANDHIDEVRESLEGWPASAGFAPGVVAVDTPAAPTPVADIGEVAGLARQHGEPFGRGGTVDIDSPPGN